MHACVCVCVCVCVCACVWARARALTHTHTQHTHTHTHTHTWAKVQFYSKFGDLGILSSYRHGCILSSLTYRKGSLAWFQDLKRFPNRVLMYIAIPQTTEVTREKSFAVHHNVGKTFAVLFDKNEKHIQLVLLMALIKLVGESFAVCRNPREPRKFSPA